MAKISVMLVDDHTVLRSGLKLLLENQTDIAVVTEASDGFQAVVLAKEHLPDIILLDLTMPKLSGLEAMASLRKASPQSKILVLTMHDDESYMERALRMGASGYVLKKAADAEVISAIRAVMRGEIYIHSPMMRSLLDGMHLPDQSSASQDRDGWSSLSDREKEVLQLVAMGHTNAEIAEKLSLSVKTIETYRARGMEKLNLRSRATLVKFALEHGLLGDH